MFINNKPNYVVKLENNLTISSLTIVTTIFLITTCNYHNLFLGKFSASQKLFEFNGIDVMLAMNNLQLLEKGDYYNSEHINYIYFWLVVY